MEEKPLLQTKKERNQHVNVVDLVFQPKMKQDEKQENKKGSSHASIARWIIRENIVILWKRFILVYESGAKQF